MSTAFLLESSSSTYRLLAAPLYLVGARILFSLAFLPTLTEAVECGTPTVLVEKRRIATDLLQRILAVLSEPDPSLIVVPIDLAVSLAVQNIDRDTVPDMPDRIIAATALHLNLPLVTRDRKIQASQSIITIW